MRDADYATFIQPEPLTITAEYRLTIADPTQQSCGYIYQVGFPSGLFLLIEHYDLQEDLFVETVGFDIPALQFGFAVVGDDEPFERIYCRDRCSAIWKPKTSPFSTTID